MENEVVMCLEKVKSILGENGEHWTKEYYALTKEGIVVPADSPSAVKFCLVGAFINANCPDDIKAKQLLRRAFDSDYSSEGSLIRFNDQQKSFGPVKQALNKAIELAKKEV